MIIFCDVDGCLCTNEEGKYEKAKPYPKAIAKINRLHGLKHKIILWTARGTTTKKDWRELTEKQLKEWKVDYDELRFGKPHYDWYICDKAFTAKEFFK